MQTEPNVTPSAEDICRVWRADRRLSSGAAIVYMQRIKLFRAYCVEHGLVERGELTLERVNRFIDWYAQRRNLDPRSLHLFRSGLRSLNRIYHRLGLAPPPWRSPRPAKPPATPLLSEYADYLLRHRGNPQATVDQKLYQIGKLQDHLAQAGEDWHSIRLVDVDAFLVAYAQRYSRSYVSGVACSIRCFLRFLHWSGRIPVDLSEAVIAPVQPRLERPRRALAWEDVQRLLKAVDRSTPMGLRDYALLLMMSTYGLGAGEAIRLRFEDIDWEAGTLSVVRPKTGTAFTLPLLPAVAKALADYLHGGRPMDTPTRHLFVQMHVPFGPLAASSAIRHIVAKHARVAGISAPFLGSHVLRHSHAARQLDLGTPPRVVSELLGHRDPESLSAYVRIATETLRDIALPVPS
ncbi:MAG: integrase [Mesorhizobium sp.]|uniref:site-specific integrase n=2 Tax=unclassified Mesorhizobium TaxID=325217 RepID=UPI000FE66BA4|nr:site-specific integrase [Mesorhizobium sp.]RWN86079.1 MAG: integrase [Mesorhizobium sp.]RWO94002.1 MAG: integrase [Mesorhizobium sp.]TIM52459.1 MAG: integrase [Mesorhizobium sp.]